MSDRERGNGTATRWRLESALRWACIGFLVLIGVATLATVGAWTQDVAAHGKAGASDPQTTTLPNPQDKPGEDLKSAEKDLQSEIEADRASAGKSIDEKLEDAKTLLNLLTALVGVYSILVGVTAFVTVKFARDDAKEQIKSLQEGIEKIQQQFPEFGALHERMDWLVREMQRSMPSESDWNDDETYRALTEEERQRVLHNEVAVTAISLFALDRSAMMRSRLAEVYAAFARFYLGRHNTSADGPEADYERALYYAVLSVRFGQYSAKALRLRGAIYLARYARLKKAGPATIKDKVDLLLSSAESDLKDAIAKDTAESVDAGAHYNMALVQYYQDDIPGAVSTCRHLIALEKKLTTAHREKYLPDTYVNLACLLAMLAQKNGAADPQEMAQLSREAVEALQAGWKDFKATMALDRGLAQLRKGIERELEAGKDLDRLTLPYKEQILDLLKPVHQPTAPATLPPEAVGATIGC